MKVILFIKFQVRVRTLDAEDIEKEFGDDENDERAKMLEQKVKKQLESLGLNLQGFFFIFHHHMLTLDFKRRILFCDSNCMFALGLINKRYIAKTVYIFSFKIELTFLGKLFIFILFFLKSFFNVLYFSLFLDKIKVKVITTKDKFNQVSKGEELLSTDQLDDVKDMFLGLLVSLIFISYP